MFCIHAKSCICIHSIYQQTFVFHKSNRTAIIVFLSTHVHFTDLQRYSQILDPFKLLPLFSCQYGLAEIQDYVEEIISP